MYCQNCGSEIKEGASFCQNCGTAVVKQEDTNNSSNNVNPVGEYTPTNPAEPVKAKKKRKGCLIGIIVVIVLIAFISILGSIIENSPSTLAKSMDLNEEQEAEILSIFEKCGIQNIVSVQMEMQNETSTLYNVRDSETCQFNENKDFDVWINNESKKVEEIDYPPIAAIVYAKGKVENKLPECYVSMEEREHYWPLATDAVKKFLLDPNTAAFYDADKCRFGLHTGDVFIQGCVVASDSFGKSTETDYQVTFEKRTDKVIYLRLDGVEYITYD